MERRSDIPVSSVRGSSRTAIGLEWTARLAAVGAIVMLALTLGAIHRGKVVQESAKGIVKDFHTANDYFAQRADFHSPTVAREEMQELRRVLAQLQQQTADDVNMLGATLPDVHRLVDAGRGDVRIAHRLTGMAKTLQRYSGDLRTVAVDSDKVVSAVNADVERSTALVRQLNAQLAEIERKLAAVPTAPVTPQPQGGTGLLPPILGGNP